MNARDVAAYVISLVGPLSAMKLQKLVYYCQAWSLAWTGKPLFTDRIEAWANGPVIRSLYSAHRGEFEVSEIGGDPNHLDVHAQAIVRSIVDAYGRLSPQVLSEMTHGEEPWIEARRGAAPGARSEAEISQRSMRSYYGFLGSQQSSRG
jgi:uncharacterized phage-associated protein